MRKRTIEKSTVLKAAAILTAVMIAIGFAGCALKAPAPEAVADKAKTAINEKFNYIAGQDDENEKSADNSIDIKTDGKNADMMPVKKGEKVYFPISAFSSISGDSMGELNTLKDKFLEIPEKCIENGSLEKITDFFNGLYEIVIDGITEKTSDGHFDKEKGAYEYDFELNDEELDALIEKAKEYVSDESGKLAEGIQGVIDEIISNSTIIDSIAALFGDSGELIDEIKNGIKESINKETLETELKKALEELLGGFDSIIRGTMSFAEENEDFFAEWKGELSRIDGSGNTKIIPFEWKISNDDDDKTAEEYFDEDDIFDIDSLFEMFFSQSGAFMPW